MANLRCSIEMEPRTLSVVQLNHAREIAADVVQKMETNEASTIFIEGLRSIGSIKGMERIFDEEGEQRLEKVVEWKEEKAQVLERPNCQCQCLCDAAANIVESQEQEKLQEPLSAPF